MRFSVALLAAAVLAVTGCARAAPEAAAPSAAFLAKNATAPGVKVTASGLQYKVLTSGPADGVPPGPSAEVKVNYEGKLIDGTTFDSSYDRGEPAVLSVDHVIPGLDRGPAADAAGRHLDDLCARPCWAMATRAPAMARSPAGAALIFKIELISVQK